MASVQRRKSECPLCRACFPADLTLEVNGELRDLVALFATLHTVEQADGWQELAAIKVMFSTLHTAEQADGWQELAATKVLYADCCTRKEHPEVLPQATLKGQQLAASNLRSGWPCSLKWIERSSWNTNSSTLVTRELTFKARFWESVPALFA